MKNNYINIAKNVIDLEIRGLQKLKKFINKNFIKAVHAIANCQSKVILAGVGKSGLIASKIASTFSSVGTLHISFLLMIVLTVTLERLQKKMFFVN